MPHHSPKSRKMRHLASSKIGCRVRNDLQRKPLITPHPYEIKVTTYSFISSTKVDSNANKWRRSVLCRTCFALFVSACSGTHIHKKSRCTYLSSNKIGHSKNVQIQTYINRHLIAFIFIAQPRFVA